jgi:quercetin dioxygenase-like cupin family protein
MDSAGSCMAPFVCEPGAGTTLTVLGMTHLYKAMGKQTAGAFSLWEALFPPGVATPPHTHEREDEALYVLDGKLQAEFEGEPGPREVGVGGFIFGARGRRHTFRNVSDRLVRVLVLCTPSRGLDDMFQAFHDATRHGEPPLEELASIAAKYGVRIEPAGVTPDVAARPELHAP